jgi:hypothetical protein
MVNPNNAESAIAAGINMHLLISNMRAVNAAFQRNNQIFSNLAPRHIGQGVRHSVSHRAPLYEILTLSMEPARCALCPTVPYTESLCLPPRVGSRHRASVSLAELLALKSLFRLSDRETPAGPLLAAWRAKPGSPQPRVPEMGLPRCERPRPF